ncbi:MAG: hypothetical protein ACREA3_00450 [Nitrosotalea sp.]
MKILQLLIIVGAIVTAIIILLIFVINSQQSSNQSISCSEELKEFQYNLELSKRQQVESILMTDPTIKKFIDNSSYCEFMSLGTLYTGNGSYQIFNINLNNTKELVAEVSLQNKSVVTYNIDPLVREYPAVSVEPFDIILPYLFFAVISAGIIIYVLKIRKRK